MNPQPPLVLDNLAKSYVIPGQQARRVVLHNVSITLRPGEVYGFIGLNGAGKTTTLKIAMGLTHSDTGSVSWFGAPGLAGHQHRVGFAPEKPSFPQHLTGEEILQFSERLLGLNLGPTRRLAVLEQTGLAHATHQRVAEYSQGMQQRLALAAALLHDPEVLLLDEPSNGLDPLGRRMIKDLIRSLQQRGKSILFSTHILPDVTELCDRVGVIHQGRMLFEGARHELCSSGADLEQRFIELIGSPTTSEAVPA